MISEMKQYQKDYYQKNRKQMLAYGCEKMECDHCHRIVSRNQLLRHKKTKICAKNTISKHSEPSSL